MARALRPARSGGRHSKTSPTRDARERVGAAQDNVNQAQDLYRGKKNNEMQIPICSRSGDVIEPRMTPQWWVNCKEMAKRSTDAR